METIRSVWNQTTSCRLPIAVLSVVLLVAPALGQGSRGPYTDVKELPAGPVGERIEELVAVINSGSPQRVQRLIEERFADSFRAIAPLEDHLRVFAQVYEQSRGFELHGVRRYEQPAPPEEHVVIVRNRLTGAWQGIAMMIGTAEPYAIQGLNITAARPPKDLPPLPEVGDEEIATELRAFVNKLAEAEAFSGSVLLARGGEVLFEGAWGMASKRFAVPNRLDTRFNLGSMNKMFTSVAVCQLVERGKLSLDDPLTSFLPPGWLEPETSDKIQVQHLLTHTSGLGNYFNDEYMRSSRALFRELADYRPLIEGDRSRFEPGTDWRYSNTGMFLLGFVIEKASGQNYFDYIRDNIYLPAGMADSDSFDMDRPVANLAIGYSRGDGGWENNLYKHVIRGGPAGGGFSTAPDLLRFAGALRAHELLGPEMTARMLSGKPKLSSPTYGYGFQITDVPGDRIVGHGGGFPGINSNLDVFLDSGYTAIVLSNYSGAAMPVQEKMRELVGRRKR